jgi:hypothetical protein
MSSIEMLPNGGFIAPLGACHRCRPVGASSLCGACNAWAQRSCGAVSLAPAMRLVFHSTAAWVGSS